MSDQNTLVKENGSASKESAAIKAALGIPNYFYYARFKAKCKCGRPECCETDIFIGEKLCKYEGRNMHYTCMEELVKQKWSCHKCGDYNTALDAILKIVSGPGRPQIFGFENLIAEVEKLVREAEAKKIDHGVKVETLRAVTENGLKGIIKGLRMKIYQKENSEAWKK